MADKAFDLMLYGATGFTGRLAAAYILAHAPKGLRWAIAGRDRARLEALNTGAPILVADARNAAEVEAMVAKTRVLATTAGPFRLYGDPLVDACVRHGVHYADISGETARIRDLIDRRHEDARSAGVRVVNFCAASSAPSDIGVDLLNRHFAGRLVEAKGYFELGGGAFNGGTIASMSLAIESGDAARERDPFLLNPERRWRPSPLERDPKGVRFDREIKAWTTPSPMGTSDTRAVRRSSALNGRDIVYQEYAAFPGGFPAAFGFNATVSLFGTAMGLAPLRRLIQEKVPPGAGPTEAEMDSAWFRLKILGTSDSGRKAMATLAGKGDLGNRTTVMCLCECALALALDEPKLPPAFGVLTPSVAFGQVLPARLRAAGLEISLEDRPGLP